MGVVWRGGVLGSFGGWCDLLGWVLMGCVVRVLFRVGFIMVDGCLWVSIMCLQCCRFVEG